MSDLPECALAPRQLLALAARIVNEVGAHAVRRIVIALEVAIPGAFALAHGQRACEDCAKRKRDHAQTRVLAHSYFLGVVMRNVSIIATTSPLHEDVRARQKRQLQAYRQAYLVLHTSRACMIGALASYLYS